MIEEIQSVFQKIMKILGIYQVAIDHEVIEETIDSAEYIIRKAEKTHYFYIINPPNYMIIRKAKAYNKETGEFVDIYRVILAYDGFTVVLYLDEKLNILDIS
jgi:hypothetical protein